MKKRIYLLISILTVFYTTLLNSIELNNDLNVEQYLKILIESKLNEFPSLNCNNKTIKDSPGKNISSNIIENGVNKIENGNTYLGEMPTLQDFEFELKKKYKQIRRMIIDIQDINNYIKENEKLALRFNIKNIESKRDEKMQLIGKLKNINITETLATVNELSKKINTYGTDIFNDIKRNIDALKDEISTIAGQLETNEVDKFSFQCSYSNIQNIFSSINFEMLKVKDKIIRSSNLQSEFTTNVSIKEDIYKNVPDNFLQVSIFAFKALKTEIICKFKEVNLSEESNESFEPEATSSFYDLIKIKSLEIPVICRQTKKTASELAYYYVELKANFISTERFEIFEYYFDCTHNLIWAKPKDNFVVYNEIYNNNSVNYFHTKLNKESSKGQLKKNQWRLVSKEDLDEIINDEKLLISLKIKNGENYWVPVIKDKFIYTYKIIKSGNREMELILEKRASTDGACCLFVKALEEEE